MSYFQQFIDTRYNKALKVALAQILIAGLLSALMLDFGGVFRQFLCVVLVYLAQVAFVVFRRPTTPMLRDLFIVKYAFAVLFAMVFVADCLYPPFHEWFQRRLA